MSFQLWAILFYLFFADFGFKFFFSLRIMIQASLSIIPLFIVVLAELQAAKTKVMQQLHHLKFKLLKEPLLLISSCMVVIIILCITLCASVQHSAIDGFVVHSSAAVKTLMSFHMDFFHYLKEDWMLFGAPAFSFTC